MNNNNVEIRVPLGQGELLLDTVYRKGSHEYVAFGLVSHARLGRRTVLLLRHIMPLPDEDYIPSFGHGAAWRGTAMIPIMRQAVDEGLGVIIFHAHLHDGQPFLSPDDEASAERLLPIFRQRVPARPCGSVVLSRTCAGGIVYVPGENRPRTAITIRWYGATITDWTLQDRRAIRDGSLFESQALVVGKQGQENLRHSKVAVVGLSGGGSHVVQQLAHMGVATIVAIDSDRVAPRNRHRMVGLSWLDVLLRRRKADVMNRVVRRLGTGTRCVKVFAKVPEPAAVEALKQVDVIVGCVDNLHGRMDIQDLASRFLVPFVDIGVNIRKLPTSNAHDPRVIIGGNVITFVPGGFCLWCCGFLSEEKLGAERNGPNRSYFQNRLGEAQVVSLNGIVASQAVTEVLQLLTGFGGSGIRLQDVALAGEHSVQRGFRKLDGARGTLIDWGARKKLMCEHCNASFARGDMIWSVPRK